MSQGSDQQAPSVINSLHWRLPLSIPSPFTLEHSSQGKVPPHSRLLPCNLNPTQEGCVTWERRGDLEKRQRPCRNTGGGGGGVQADSHLPAPPVHHLLVSPISVVGFENVGPFCGIESEIPPTLTQRNPEWQHKSEKQ